jgi:hypothetical protein
VRGQETRAQLEFGGADAVVGDERFGVGEIGWDAGGGDGVVAVDALRHFEVEVKELLEEVAFGGETVGGEDGGVEGGVGVFQRVVAGEFERAIDGAEVAKSTARVGKAAAWYTWSG